MQPTSEVSVGAIREQRVRFKHPVRVVPIGGPPRAYRVLSANLSREGMFLKMPTPFDTGTKVALSLEAGGRVLPFAQAEVIWRDLEESKLPGRGAGFGYVTHTRSTAAVRVHIEEARMVREAIDRALLRAFSPSLRPTTTTMGEGAEDLRDEFTRWIDALLLTGAAVPSYLQRRLEAAFDEVVAETPGFKDG